MQSTQQTNPKQFCEVLLTAQKRYNTEHSILSSENKIVDRLLSRDVEMQDVYAELHDKLAHRPPALEVFLGLVLSVAAFWNPERVSSTREQKKDLILVNEKISIQATKLACLIEKREVLNNESGFSDNTHYSVNRVIEKAARNNHLFVSNIKNLLPPSRPSLI